MSSSCFKLYRTSSISFISSNVGEFFGLKDYIKVQEKKRRVVVFCSHPPQNVKLGSLIQVVVVQQWQRNVWKSMMLVQSCCFAKLNLSLLCCSRCHHHRSCLRSLICNWPLPTVGAFRPGLATLYVFWSFSGKLKKLLMYENLLTGKNVLTAYKICVHK